jgi:hypothetical protein
MANEVETKWLTDPENDDYPAAASYLSLLNKVSTGSPHLVET